MSEFLKQVKYIAGKGVRLASPLSDGRDEFQAELIYDVTNINDYKRLIKSGNFIDVTPKPAKAPKATETKTEEAS